MCLNPRWSCFIASAVEEEEISCDKGDGWCWLEEALGEENNIPSPPASVHYHGDDIQQQPEESLNVEDEQETLSDTSSFISDCELVSCSAPPDNETVEVTSERNDGDYLVVEDDKAPGQTETALDMTISLLYSEAIEDFEEYDHYDNYIYPSDEPDNVMDIYISVCIPKSWHVDH